MAKLTSIRYVLSIAAAYDLEIEQLDVKTTFLHGDLEEEIYMRQPEGFVCKGKEDLVCRLRKSLYGLKQSPRMWYQKFDSYVLQHGFSRSNVDHCVYVKRLENVFVILTLYVDDMLLIGNSKELINSVKGLLAAQFDMKDLGAANFILGMQITRDRQSCKLWLWQRKYIEEVLKKFNMVDCKPVKTPMTLGVKLSTDQCPKSEEDAEEMTHVPYASAVGSLMYAMVCTRPDIAQAVGVLSRFMSNPGKEHWSAVKRVLRYLRGTSDLSLCYGGMATGDELDVIGFVDADWGGDLDSRRSTSGYVFSLFGAAVCWMSKRQSTVALSSTEAEYMALTHAGKEAMWLRRLSLELGFKLDAVKIGCDNQGAIYLAKNPAFHSRSKHIDIQYHFIRQKVEERLVLLKKVDTLVNAADFLTKAVSLAKFTWCVDEIGLHCVKYSPSGRMLELSTTSALMGNGDALGGPADRSAGGCPAPR